MNPILLDLGVIKIYWYSVLVILGMIAAGRYVNIESKKYKLDKEFIENLYFWVIVLGVVGARLYYVAFNFDFYKNNPIEILKIWEGGLAIHGGIIAGLIFTLIYAKKYKVKPLLMLDIIVVGVILGQAIGRWGNFFNGEAHGPITSIETLQKLLVPGFVINGMKIGSNYYLPTFYFESIWCLIGFITLLLVRRKKYLKIGQLSAIYFIWYGIGRIFVEYYRTDSLMLGNIKVAQIISGIMILIGIIMFFAVKKGSRFDNLYNPKEEE